MNSNAQDSKPVAAPSDAKPTDESLTQWMHRHLSGLSKDELRKCKVEVIRPQQRAGWLPA